jgi:hypothetical protein
MNQYARGMQVKKETPVDNKRNSPYWIKEEYKQKYKFNHSSGKSLKNRRKRKNK